MRVPLPVSGRCSDDRPIELTDVSIGFYAISCKVLTGQSV